MKARFAWSTGVLAVVAVALAIIPATREEIHWQLTSLRDRAVDYQSYLESWPEGRHVTKANFLYDERSWAVAASANTIQDFGRYLQSHPNGKHVAEVRDKIESLRWRDAISSNTVKGFERYLQVYPNGKHVTEARDKLEYLRWQDAVYANTSRAIQNYLTQYPKGRFAELARSEQAKLLADYLPFFKAIDKRSEEALKTFLEEFPGHKHEADARLILQDMEGRNIVDLLKEKKIIAKASGIRIKNVKLELKPRVEYKVTVLIPVGTFFLCNGSAQNMVTTQEETVVLKNDLWTTINIEVACANRRRDIPDGKDTFTIERFPKQQELQELMPLLRKANVSFATRQAAVWIVTDDADYGDLGSLVSRAQFQVSGGSRMIKESDCAKAMQICQEAGIDITKKRIWQDRDQIIRGLPDGSLKTWLKGISHMWD
ncbi:MAG: hypothetical protein PVH77_11295 [Phycisphaerales bacterium]